MIYAAEIVRLRMEEKEIKMPTGCRWEKVQLEDLDIGGNMILKRILKK
jgi:hypothetical protein